MGMTRRELLKLSGLAAAGAAVAGCSIEGGATPAAAAAAAPKLKADPAPTNKRVVVVGGGFGGLTMAKQLRVQSQGQIEVVLLERNSIFFACPFSNALLGGLEDVELGTFEFDYARPSLAHGYDFVQCEVTAIDKGSKTVTTSKGTIKYDFLVLSPGIEYDYAKQFPKWGAEKARAVQAACPPALIPGGEHLALHRQMQDMEDGNIIIVPPAKGKYRCPPAPYERTAMCANFMIQNEIGGKVIVLDTRGGKFAKGKAFKESWKDLYGDKIEYRGFTEVTDVDVKNKTIHFIEYKNTDDLEGVKKSLPYQVCNLIPNNKANPVIKMAGIKTNGWGGAILAPNHMFSVDDNTIYVVGDAQGTHKIPPSGQMAYSATKVVAKHLADRIKAGKMVPCDLTKSSNVCYSMVGGAPEEAIMVTHKVSVLKGGVFKGSGHVPKDSKTGKFRSPEVASATRDWFNGIMNDLFA